jgi:glycosyltransferase involved in cell wall biosynthesis
MIVKNEEKNIGKCLHKIKPLADEIIVADTGSTDRTKEIAKIYGAKVYDFPWTDSFSDARNHSLSKATGAWTFVLDADETIGPSDFESLKNLLKKSTKSTAYSFITRNYITPMNTAGWVANAGTYLYEEAGSGWFQSKKVRLFPNDRRIRFESPVHEFVENSLIDAGIIVKDCEIPVHHYGKLDMERLKAKGEQYYELGKLKWTERGEQDPLAIYELAVQASELGKFDEAEVYFERVVTLLPNFSKALYGLGNTCFRLGKFEDAFSATKRAIHNAQEDTTWRDAVILFAHTAVCIGKAEEGIEYLNQLLNKYPDDPKYQDDPLSVLLLAISYLSIGREEKAMVHLQQLKEKALGAVFFLTDFAKHLMANQKAQTALILLKAAQKSNMVTSELSSLLMECEKRIKETNGESVETKGDTIEKESRIQGVSG